MNCKPWDVVVVPFPFVEKAMQKPRPVLVLSGQEFASQNGHFAGAMITTAQDTSWLGDTPIENLESAGLPKPSVIRLKLFTLPKQANLRIIGMLDLQDQTSFLKNWQYQMVN